MRNPKPPPSPPPPATSGQSGRAAFDSRGNAVWEWKTENGEYSANADTQRVKSLDLSELSLEETGRIKKQDGLSVQNDRAGGGFNPYDSRAPRAPASTAPKPRKPIKDLRAYSEWMKMKKRLADEADED